MRRILRLQDPLVQEFCKLATKKDFRSSKKRCVVAGTKLVQDLSKRHHFHDLLTAIPDDPAAEGLHATNRYIADARSLRRIARLTSFEGLVATLDLPRPRFEDLVDPRLVLCLDYIEDPGILGTLLRTAVAFQWQAVYFLPHCVDPFHPRCVRASQGALFEIPFGRGSMEDLQKMCRRKRITLCVSHASGIDIGSAAYDPPPNGVALILREEYATPWGPPQAAMKIRVPDPWPHSGRQPQDADDKFNPGSLDVAVAGGILMHHIKHFHYPQIARSPLLASPTDRA
mmetsp:Transcript_23263/g.65776  ORF Transcript_23263/g.65776 Transcript_23263/m.65776 type:complete len:285 (+) Transcript_23263:60-914(+)